jgi:predicted anti-sigma-YlaC factor YlaD
MLRALPENDCIAARKRVSLELDGQLSELGTARLRAHLRACPSCAAFAATTRAATGELRRAPLEQPSRPLVLTRPPRTLAIRRPLSIAAALLLFLAGVGGSFLLGTRTNQGHRTTTVVAAPVARGDIDQTFQHMLAAASAFGTESHRSRPFAV